MSWDSWCNQALVVKGETVGSEAGIFCKSTGAKWASKPPTFQVPPDVVLSIGQHIEGTRRDGVKINDEKYMFLRNLDMDGHKYAVFKCGPNGLSCALTNQCVIIGRYTEGMQHGKHSEAVYKMMMDLKSVNY